MWGMSKSFDIQFICRFGICMQDAKAKMLDMEETEGDQGTKRNKASKLEEYYLDCTYTTPPP